MDENIAKKENDNITLSTPMSDIADKIMEETDVDRLKNIIDIFNLNIQKKSIIRSSKLSDIQDLITNQMEQRVKQKPDEFNNKDLIDYFKVVQETLNKADNSLDNINTPAIQVNQNQFNINVNNENILDRDSRERIMDAVKNILGKIDTESKNEPIILNETEVSIDDISDYT